MTTKTRGTTRKANTGTEAERVGATLRTIRELRGYTPDELAREIGISRPYLANIEAGRKPLSDVLLAKVATELKVRQIAIMRADANDAA